MFRESPTKHGSVSGNSSNTLLTFSSRVRNTEGELWFETAKNKFVPLEDVALLFDETALLARQYIDVWNFSDKETKLTAIYDLFKPDGEYDVKAACNLGNRTDEFENKLDSFTVLFNNGRLSRQMDGESIGNILYGFVMQKNRDAVRGRNLVWRVCQCGLTR